ncbi:hypothetical protein DUI87_05795 [Hirundo rustica rustica]|uniref:Reverse transcriptase domain-containing protein n=1 Tax=Hirundo rustica rustica TaxID=333673 RepID=A0A3M0KVI3_HIRRU|nr:hypothetical protein DUI87_05795 [Hirundo rustica rustica]
MNHLVNKKLAGNGGTQRFEVDGLMSSRTLMTNGILQGLLLRQVLFNTFVSDKHSGIECSLSQLAKDTRMCGVIGTLEGRDAIQRGPDRLENGACENVLDFNKAMRHNFKELRF